MDVVSWLLSRAYVNKTLVGMGALKGAPAMISGITDNPDGTHDVTFSWIDNDDVTHTSVLTVANGETPTITTTEITGGHRVQFTTTNPAQSKSFDVIDGVDGTDGISVTNAEIDDETQHLIITLSDGSTVDCGQVKGAQVLSELEDVNITSPQNGQILVYDAIGNVWKNGSPSATSTSLDDLSNVNIDNVENGQTIVYDAENEVWVNGESSGATSVSDLTDVDLTNLTNGDVLTYNQTSSKWENNDTLSQIALDITELQGSVVSVTGRVSDLETSVNAMDGEIDAITLDVSALQSSVLSVTGRVGTAEDKILTLESADTRIELDVSALQGSVIGINGKIPSNASTSNKMVTASDISDFITNTVSNLVNYYTKTETYTKTEVDNIVSAIENARFEVVSELPTSDIETNVIYLVPKASAQTNNIKDEYINLDGTSAGWELIGDTEIDLSGYVTTSDLNTALADYTTTTDLATLLALKQNILLSSAISVGGVSKSTVEDTLKALADEVNSVDVMTGATASENGTSGLVPQPLIADKDKFLKGDGTWKDVNTNFVGTMQEWTNEQDKSQYKTIDIIDDVDGYMIDTIPTRGSQNLITSGGAYNALKTKVNKSELTSISIIGNTNNTGSKIYKNTCFYLNDVLVRAIEDIANGSTFTLNTNYEEMPDILNSILGSGVKATFLTSTSSTTELSVSINIAKYKLLLLRITNSAQTTIYGSDVISVDTLKNGDITNIIRYFNVLSGNFTGTLKYVSGNSFTVSVSNSSYVLEIYGIEDLVNGSSSTPSTSKADKTDLTSIIETGLVASQPISSGTYFYLNDVLVKAIDNIASNATFVFGTNYEEVTAGGLNDVKNPVTEYIDVNIQGVSLYKCGNVVQLVINKTISESTGGKWLTLGVLPQHLRPKVQLNGCGYDNSGSTYADAQVIASRVLASDGSISVYVFNDHKSFDFRCEMTYLI